MRHECYFRTRGIAGAGAHNSLTGSRRSERSGVNDMRADVDHKVDSLAY